VRCSIFSVFWKKKSGDEVRAKIGRWVMSPSSKRITCRTWEICHQNSGAAIVITARLADE
jgi:uncharacterized cupin superfamily protein